MRYSILTAAAILGLASSLPAQAQDCGQGTFFGAFAGEEVIPQNWNCQEREEFWFTDQGSQIIPYAWALHLEQADSTERFFDSANMDRYRYLPQKPTSLNPDGLPIGFTRSREPGEEAWLGLTCAACHTAQIEYEGRKYLIDGAPTMADFEGMMIGLAEAMQVTLDDSEKFASFAANVASGGDKAMLREQLAEMTATRHDWNQRNRGSEPYGHARLDAIGAIFNETAATALGRPSNADCGGTPCANAPVSYPFVWDTPQHDFVQWNGSVENAGAGALGRNVGEVLGVFGDLHFNEGRRVLTVTRTSVDMGGLGRLEDLMSTLQSPRWQDTQLPEIRSDLAAQGAELYQQYCVSCHELIDRSDPDRRIKARMFPVSEPDNPNALNTDPTMALNFLKRTSKAPELSGRPVSYVASFFRDVDEFDEVNADQQPNTQILEYLVTGSIVRGLIDDPKGTIAALRAGQPSRIVRVINNLEGRLGESGNVAQAMRVYRDLIKEVDNRRQEPVQHPECSPPDIRALCYKARPLNGIWATAPYLHNGSVRSLRDLLLPANQRAKVFQVGSREFDPINIGFADAGASTVDTTKAGNSQLGHEGPAYGNAELAADPGKMDALLEYLKTL